MTTSQKSSQKYENNPLVVTVEGLKLLFDKAQQVAIFIAVLIGILSIASFVIQISGSLAEQAMKNSPPPTSKEQLAQLTPTLQPGELGMIAVFAVVGLVICLGFVLLNIYLLAITDYTAAKVAAGKPVTLREAAGEAWRQFGGYLWVITIASFKLFAWSLLFIIPGIYKSVRYSLAGVSYFSDSAQLRGDKAVQHSNHLTRGAWLTTFSSLSFFNMLTGGLIEPLLTMSSKTVLFRQYSALGDEPKPKAHVLSWVGLFLPIMLTILVILLVGGMIALIAASGELPTPK